MGAPHADDAVGLKLLWKSFGLGPSAAAYSGWVWLLQGGMAMALISYA